MNSNTSDPQDFNSGYDDEISIGELIQKLWRKRGLIVMLPLVLAGLTVTGLLMGKAASPEKLSYYIELTGVKDSAYPNGTAFSPQDLLSPQVVTQLVADFGITDPQSVGESIAIEYGTPLSMGILVEYRAALDANSKASAEELALINQRYETRLNDAMRRGLRIAVDYTGLGLEKSRGVELAYALPRLWNSVFSAKFRIFLDSGIAGVPTISEASDLTTSVGALEAELQLASITAGISVLANDRRFRALESDGVSPADLQKVISDFQRIYFEPIYANSFKEAVGLSEVYRRDLKLQLMELEATLSELNDRIAAITELQKSSAGENTDSTGYARNSSQLQIEGDALGQLVNLSRTASLSEYLQQSFDQRIEVTNQMAKIETRLQKMGANGSGGLSKAFIDSASSRYAAITARYSQLLKAAKMIAQSETPSLYAVMSGVEGEKLLERMDLLFIALALALGGMLAVIGALLWPVRGSQ